MLSCVLYAYNRFANATFSSYSSTCIWLKYKTIRDDGWRRTHVTLYDKWIESKSKENANTYTKWWISLLRTLYLSLSPSLLFCVIKQHLFCGIQFIAHFVHCKFHYFQQLLPFILTDCACVRKRACACADAYFIYIWWHAAGVILEKFNFNAYVIFFYCLLPHSNFSNLH